MAAPFKENDAKKERTSYHDELVAQKEAELGYEICGARNRDGGICSNKAGKGTDHLGTGRCKFHGGRNQSPLAQNWRHGKNSSIQTEHPELRAMMERMAEDHDVFNLEQEILKVRAIIEIVTLQSGNLEAAVKLTSDLSKIVERYHNISEGRKYVISVEKVTDLQDYVVEVINRHVVDPTIRHLIAQDLLRYRFNRSQPVNVTPASQTLLEGHVEE